MSTWAVLPVKAFERAKSRLDPALGRAGRQALAEQLFDHVLGVLLRAPGLDGVLVVSDSDAVLARATARGARGVRDAVEGALGRVIDDALAGVAAKHALIVMSDLPLLADAEVRLMLDQRAAVVIAPDRHGDGTNALLIPVPAPWPTCFGTPDSASRHQALAPDAAIVRAVGLALDIDEPGGSIGRTGARGRPGRRPRRTGMRIRARSPRSSSAWALRAPPRGQG